MSLFFFNLHLEKGLNFKIIWDKKETLTHIRCIMQLLLYGFNCNAKDCSLVITHGI